MSRVSNLVLRLRSGDDAGVAEMAPDAGERVAELWRIRTSPTRPKRFAIVDDTAAPEV